VVGSYLGARQGRAAFQDYGHMSDYYGGRGYWFDEE
jgi:hypothetical protein